VEATESELQDYCRSTLSGFEVPERIHIVADFPRTAKGSIDRRVLAARFSARTTPMRSTDKRPSQQIAASDIPGTTEAT
jgi:acyl-CoA synthetase (AMP-forming)/AMP-acid ligase II